MLNFRGVGRGSSINDGGRIGLSFLFLLERLGDDSTIKTTFAFIIEALVAKQEAAHRAQDAISRPVVSAGSASEGRTSIVVAVGAEHVEAFVAESQLGRVITMFTSDLGVNSGIISLVALYCFGSCSIA